MVVKVPAFYPEVSRACFTASKLPLTFTRAIFRGTVSAAKENLESKCGTLGFKFMVQYSMRWNREKNHTAFHLFAL